MIRFQADGTSELIIRNPDVEDSDADDAYLTFKLSPQQTLTLIERCNAYVLDVAMAATAERSRERCPAVYHHGPGSQSRTRCTYPKGHDDPDNPLHEQFGAEHYAPDPMCGGFEWEALDGWQY